MLRGVAVESQMNLPVEGKTGFLYSVFWDDVTLERKFG